MLKMKRLLEIWLKSEKIRLKLKAIKHHIEYHLKTYIAKSKKVRLKN